MPIVIYDSNYFLGPMSRSGSFGSELWGGFRT
jgi:hypothetical protein